jgi:hypothetical protein
VPWFLSEAYVFTALTVLLVILTGFIIAALVGNRLHTKGVRYSDYVFENIYKAFRDRTGEGEYVILTNPESGEILTLFRNPKVSTVISTPSLREKMEYSSLREDTYDRLEMNDEIFKKLTAEIDSIFDKEKLRIVFSR